MRNILAALLAVCILAGFGNAALIYGTNAIVNGDAESGSGSTNGSTGGTPVPGWTLTSAFLAIQWNISGGYPLNSDPGPAARGSNLFSGGGGSVLSTASQLLSVSNVATDVDSGQVLFSAEGYFGGFSDQGDHAELVISFRDATDSQISSVMIGGVTAADRSNVTALLLRTTNGYVPMGTRSILFELQLTRQDGFFNDGYADNLSFTAQNTNGIPEPATIGMAMLGVLILVSLKRFKGV